MAHRRLPCRSVALCCWRSTTPHGLLSVTYSSSRLSIREPFHSLLVSCLVSNERTVERNGPRLSPQKRSGVNAGHRVSTDRVRTLPLSLSLRRGTVSECLRGNAQ
jgi:hypothetical protein